MRSRKSLESMFMKIGWLSTNERRYQYDGSHWAQWAVEEGLLAYLASA